jgi:hypothetical protein
MVVIGWASANFNEMERKCDNCGTIYTADARNINRGWGLTCSKSCAASKREKSKIGYNPKRVKRNNIRRELWNMKTKDENEYGVFKGRYSSEGYKLYENGDEDTAVDKFGDAVYTINNWEHEHPFSDDAF